MTVAEQQEWLQSLLRVDLVRAVPTKHCGTVS